MGCCISGGSDSEYSKLVVGILRTNPVCEYSIRHCKLMIKASSDSELKRPERRSTKTLPYMCKDLSLTEDDYAKRIQSLFKIKLSISEPGVFRKKLNRSSSRSTIFKMMSFKELKKESILFDGSEVQDTVSSIIEEEQSQLSKLESAIIPTYTEISDQLIKDRPEGSFYLFLVGLCKDTSESKCKLFIDICESAGQKLNLKLFESIIQSYIQLHISFNFKIHASLASNRSGAFFKEVQSKFDIRLNSDALENWEDYNKKLILKRSILVTGVCNILCKELINLVLSETTLYSLTEYKARHRSKLDNATSEELNLLINKNRAASIELEHLIMLLNLYPFLFNSHELFAWLYNWSLSI